MTRNEIIAHLKKFKPMSCLDEFEIFECKYCPLSFDNLISIYKNQDELSIMRCSERLRAVCDKLGKKMPKSALGCGNIQRALFLLKKELLRKENLTMQIE